MTSSLVGSEMCIRDRAKCVLQSVGAHLHMLFVAAHAAHWQIPSPTLAAVSYTHLTLPTICSV
eukprot:5918132-Prorocentrum_lima.AAC.1